jgi:uncharacterized membrane protein YqjE
MAATKQSLMNVDATAPADTEGLPNLFSRLADDVMELVNSQLALFKVEIKEEASAYARGAAMIAFGAAIATVGFALLNVAIAFAVSTLFAQANFSQPASYALGFLVTGGFYVLVGAIVVFAMKNRLSRRNPMPQRTVQELRKDKQWLKNEL